MLRSALLAASLCALAMPLPPRAALGAEPPATFEQVQAILKQHCAKCHTGEKPKGGLDLASTAALAKGGESGPAVVPGHPERSPILQLIADGSMPPEDEPKLAAEQIELIRRWVAGGATGLSPAEENGAEAQIDPAARAFWAFKPLVPPPVPAVNGADRVSSDVDAFIIARLRQAGLQLSPSAERHAILRRLSFDLIGLPPTPLEIDAFVADTRPDAYERLVDRLLASPHFGERFGRHWLDGAGYSDIIGGDNDAGIVKLSENKWKYRDYVVRVLNDDMPYERFLTEQLAGDELIDWRAAPTFTPKIKELLVATGFLRGAADDTDEKELTTPDILHGVLQRTGEVVAVNLLGLTLACAKCHDHKYEPIPQRDYYRFMAAFTPVLNPTDWKPPKVRDLADISPAEKAIAEKHNAELDKQIADYRKQQAEIRRPAREKLLLDKLGKLPEQIRTDVNQALSTSADKRNEVQKYLAEKFKTVADATDAELAALLDDAPKQQIACIEQQIASSEQTRRHWGVIQAAYDVGPAPPTYLLRRGNHETPGAEVQPGFFAVLCSTASAADGVSTDTIGPQPAGQTSGRRLALVRWLTDWSSPAGALAARVRVNRIWQHLFGKGIVATSENLGLSGSKPTHPELLEWLAARFVADGRSTKSLVKLLVTSAAYRQSSLPGEGVAATASRVDPANQLLWRMPLRRLEAEIVRDALLATSNQLDLSLGGPALPLEVRPDGMVILQSAKDKPASTHRRSLYVLARRNYHLSLLGVFDQPTMSTNCPNRQQSAVVSQSLAMLNDEFVLAAADRFAARLAGASDAAAQINLAFKLALSREPTVQEVAWAQEFLSQQAAELVAANLAAGEVNGKSLAHLCHMLLSANEFLYVP